MTLEVTLHSNPSFLLPPSRLQILWPELEDWEGRVLLRSPTPTSPELLNGSGEGGGGGASHPAHDLPHPVLSAPE